MNAIQMSSAQKVRTMRYAVVFLVTISLLGCIHRPPEPDLPKGPVIEYGRPGVISR